MKYSKFIVIIKATNYNVITKSIIGVKFAMEGIIVNYEVTHYVKYAKQACFPIVHHGTYPLV